MSAWFLVAASRRGILFRCDRVRSPNATGPRPNPSLRRSASAARAVPPGVAASCSRSRSLSTTCSIGSRFLYSPLAIFGDLAHELRTPGQYPGRSRSGVDPSAFAEYEAD
jgi:hypothetical protein